MKSGHLGRIISEPEVANISSHGIFSAPWREIKSSRKERKGRKEIQKNFSESDFL